MKRKRFSRFLGIEIILVVVFGFGTSFPAFGAASPFAENVRSTPWQSPEAEQKSFHLPPGFEIQLVAAEPDILKPMNLAFDARGRLWVTVTQEYPNPAPTDRPGRDAVKILEDTDGDGRADKITTFADGLNIPIGLYPYRDGCIVWSIPHIWFFRDTDGDDRADEREPLYGPFDVSRDTHGNQSSFRRGFDGWLYCTHGFNNDSRARGRDGHEVHLNSGNTYRIRLDGSRVEHFTHGQVNPFGLSFDSLGNLFSSDCHSEPIYQLLAGAYYPSFGKPHDGLGFAPTMMEKPRGSTAIDGVTYYEDNLWPEEYRDSIFVGDVMNSVVFRDQAVARGATKIAQPRADFLTTDDPWFRPVNTILGPDGALYIADFYNRIIGHYEVPLHHPGRDRTSGRIWRVVYRGNASPTEAAAPKLHPAFDFTKATAQELVAELAHPNLTRRFLATDQLTDRIGPAATAIVRGTLAGEPINHFQTIHCRWVLQRLGALDESLLAAASHAERAVRVHAMRILADTANLTSALRELALRGLTDPDALVQRCAAEALANHPHFDNVRPLLALRHRVPENDTHLLYVARKALRDQLIPEANFDRLAATQLNDADANAIADVALGVKSAVAGSFLIRYAQQAEPERAMLAEYLRHAARYATESEFDGLAQVARAKFEDDLELQLSLLKSIQQGMEQRGATLAPSLKSWGAGLAERLLTNASADTRTWFNTPLENAGGSANPWFLQKRRSADGDADSLFLCSLPPGGESFTGVLRSQPFTVPSSLTFWLAGHDGPPDKPPQKKNFIRLRLVSERAQAESTPELSEILAEAWPPRNDVAQRITWDLSRYAGRQGVLEITDGDTGGAYAWLAVGRFSPNVAPLPSVSPSLVEQRHAAAAELASSLRLTNLVETFADIASSEMTGAETRLVAARALASLRAATRFASLAPLLSDTALALALRLKLAEALSETVSGPAEETLAETFRAAPRRAQLKLAQALAANAEGSETLLGIIASGQASPGLLLDATVRDKLLAAARANVSARMDELTEGLPPASEEIDEQIRQRVDAYASSETNPTSGAAAFAKACAACHSIDGQGGNIAPQLDGIGARGLERLCEDILDPNRNVDLAFRATLLILKDGEVASGLFRREEGELIVLADGLGNEVSIPKRNVTERRESPTSLMPANFGDILTPQEFNDLLTFLVSKGR